MELNSAEMDQRDALGLRCEQVHDAEGLQGVESRRL